MRLSIIRKNTSKKLWKYKMTYFLYRITQDNMIMSNNATI